MNYLVPEFNSAIPTSSSYFTGFDWMPSNIDANLVMYFHSSIILAALPIPEPQFAVCISTADELTIGRKGESAGIARTLVSSKLLLSVELEPSLAVVDSDPIVHGLPSKVFPVGVHS